MKDAMMGYPPGISDGGKSPFTNGPLNLDDEQRSQIIGRAFNAYQVQAHAASMGFAEVEEKHSRPMAKGNDALKALEKKLAEMTDAQLVS